MLIHLDGTGVWPAGGLTKKGLDHTDMEQSHNRRPSHPTAKIQAVCWINILGSLEIQSRTRTGLTGPAVNRFADGDDNYVVFKMMWVCVRLAEKDAGERIELSGIDP